MTQVRKQTSFCLFARPARPSLNKVVRGYLGHKSIQTRTKLKEKTFFKGKMGEAAGAAGQDGQTCEQQPLLTASPTSPVSRPKTAPFYTQENIQTPGPF